MSIRVTSMRESDRPQHADPFRDLVARDAKYQHTDRVTAEDRAYLRSREGCERWLDALQELRNDVEAQLTERKARSLAYQQECLGMGRDGKAEWFRYRAEYDVWRSRATRYLKCLLNRIREARNLVERYQADEDPVAMREALVKVYAFLDAEGTVTDKGHYERNALLEEIAEVLG